MILQQILIKVIATRKMINQTKVVHKIKKQVIVKNRVKEDKKSLPNKKLIKMTLKKEQMVKVINLKKNM